MRNHQTSHSAGTLDAVLRMSSPSTRKLGLGAVTIAAVVGLHVIGLYWALTHSASTVKMPQQQPSTITFELSAPTQQKAEVQGAKAPTPAVAPEQKPVIPVKPKPEPKKKPIEKKSVEKPKPAKPASAPAKEHQASPPDAASTSAASSKPADSAPANGSPSAATPAGTGAQNTATVPAQVGRFQANNPNPKYPMQARRRRMEGLVVLAVRVSEDGRVVDARVKTSSGYNLLDDSALETVRLWQFEPGRQGSSAAASWTDVRINFRLN